MRCQNVVRTLSEHCQNAVRTLSERPGLCQNICGSSTNQVKKFLLSKKNEHAYSPPSILSPLAWRASPPALGIAYCTRLPWAPPARWGFPALSGSLALNLGSLPNAGRMSDEVSALVCPFPVMASPGLATMNESSHSQGTPAYLGSLIPPLFPPLSLSEMARALRA